VCRNDVPVSGSGGSGRGCRRGRAAGPDHPGNRTPPGSNAATNTGTVRKQLLYGMKCVEIVKILRLN